MKKKSKNLESKPSLNEFDGLISFEEIDSYKVIKRGKNKFMKFEDGDTLKKDKSKKKANNSKATVTSLINYQENMVENIETNISLKRKRENDHSGPKHKKEKNINLEAWKSIFVPDAILRAIQDIGYESPTEIQKLTIPAAIKGRKDIIGAAETGSGKTLAFVIPIIHGILREKEQIKLGLIENTSSENEVEESDGDEDSDNSSPENSIGCVKVIDDIKDEEFDSGNILFEPSKSLKALIIAPTRELAVQIKKHTDALLCKTDIKSVAIIGGLSLEKHERLLKKKPEIVIGTPGRLWELIQNGNRHLADVSHIRFLAIDETDRMLEKGHFEELEHLLELINSEPEFKERRQNFVFSATLTFTPDVPERLKTKKKAFKITKEMKLESLSKMIGLHQGAKVVDITRKFGTAERLSESKILCDKDEKDDYLYYLLNQHPGRTLIFCNSINCVKRLSNLLTILQCKPNTLHASKQQKQRLKNLERFTANDRSILLATDVAARGIDIPGIDHIIHYEVPRTVEIYVHRSGRTARANHEGLSILLVDTSDIGKYRQFCKSLNRTSELDNFPINEDVFQMARERVKLARDIEKLEYRSQKENKEKLSWNKMVQEAGVGGNSEDEDDDQACEKSLQKKKIRSEIHRKKLLLSQMLPKSLAVSSLCSRYPTSSGKLNLSQMDSKDCNGNTLLKKKSSTIESIPILKKNKFKWKRSKKNK